jgi:hypothetical protein
MIPSEYLLCIMVLKKSNVGILKVKRLSLYVCFIFQIAHSLLMFN